LLHGFLQGEEEEDEGIDEAVAVVVAAAEALHFSSAAYE